MTNREALAVADLIPEDVILPTCDTVAGYPYGVRGLPGTVVPMWKVGLPFVVEWYFSNPEMIRDVLRD